MTDSHIYPEHRDLGREELISVVTNGVSFAVSPDIAASVVGALVERIQTETRAEARFTPTEEKTLRELLDSAESDISQIDYEWGSALSFERLVAIGHEDALRVVAARAILFGAAS